VDVSKIESELKDFLTSRSRSLPRYLGVIFLANSMPGLDLLKRKLMQNLAPVEIWEIPGQNGAPKIPISRYDFSNAVFSCRHPDGLIIYLPEEWMLGWADDDRRVFWSNLAQTYGNNNIYVVYAGTPSNISHLQSYFSRKNIGDSNFAILSSKYEQ
jgi:hypothetical protein